MTIDVTSVTDLLIVVVIFNLVLVLLLALITRGEARRHDQHKGVEPTTPWDHSQASEEAGTFTKQSWESLRPFQRKDWR